MNPEPRASDVPAPWVPDRAPRVRNDGAKGESAMKYFAMMALAAALFAAPAHAQTGFSPSTEASIQSVLPRMVTWRRDFHQNPELSYEEVRTAERLARL